MIRIPTGFTPRNDGGIAAPRLDGGGVTGVPRRDGGLR